MATLQELADALARDVLAAAHDDEDPIVDWWKGCGCVLKHVARSLSDGDPHPPRRGARTSWIAERLAQNAQAGRTGADGDDG